MSERHDDATAALRVRPMTPGEEDAVSALARRVFDEHSAATMPPAGHETFARYAAAEAMAARAANHRVLVAEAAGRIVGMLEVRDGTHVAMLFVDGAAQRRGVARRLLEAAFGAPAEWPALTVNSAPNAVGAYERFGFRATEPEREHDGMRFVPMRRPGAGG